MLKPASQRILIIKLGALGDVLRTTSILQGLRQKYHQCKIYWVTRKNAVPLLVNNPYVTCVIHYDHTTYHKLKNVVFDVIINLDEDFEACSLATRLQTKKLYGFYLDENKHIQPTPTAREWFTMGALGRKPKNDILKKKNKKTHAKIMHEICDLPDTNYDILYFLTQEQRAFVQAFKRRYVILDSDYVIGLNTGSGDRWPKQLDVKKTADLAQRLYKEYKAKIILFGGPNEIERNDQIVALARVPIISTGCGNDLFEFPPLVSLCNLFITSDSLGLHLALALKRKTIAFFGPTSATEIEMFDLGKKVTSPSSCYCCYKPTCTAMREVSVHHIMAAAKKIIRPEKYSIVITSFNEPHVVHAIDTFLKQVPKSVDIIIVAPDRETEIIVQGYQRKHKNVIYMKDPGRGKSYALNLILDKVKSDILIFSDGDVVVSENAVAEILSMFHDPQIGIVTGRVVSANLKNNMYGYWSHLLADAGAHRIRKELFHQRRFLECSGYLFAFRHKIIKQIPLDVAEDSYIPYIFWQKGYSIGYASNALVYVKNPTNFQDWLKQRARTSKAHETLDNYVDVALAPRVKTFTNEVKKGVVWGLVYPRTSREYIWTFILFGARAYMWGKVFMDTKIKGKKYVDGWDRVETAR